MKRYLVALIAISLSFQIACGRETNNFNNEWEFALEESPKELDEIDSLEWSIVKVPHDWSISLPYSQINSAASTGFTPAGIGWYRKAFSVSKQDLEGKVWIEFDGVYNHSTVWINGHKLGYRPNGYISFSYDLSDYLQPGENTIVVHVDRSQYVDSRWYTGSGIYRDVRLVKTNRLHIPQWGVRIDTPQVYEKQASVNVRTRLVASGGVSGETVQLNLKISDNEGNLVSDTTQNIVMDEGFDGLAHIRVFVKSPKLWSLDHPHLYNAEIRVLQDDVVHDVVTEKFGIRSIKFESDKGFSLNGEYMKFKGVNLHHDAGAVGSAVPRDIWLSRVQALKEMGCNAIRTAHNPHAPDLMDACDELGMLVLAEAFDEWNVPKDKSQVYLGDNAAPEEFNKSYPAYFDEWAETDLKDLIARDYNHPSIIMWSIGNEIEWTFRYYQRSSSYAIGDLDDEYYFSPPDFDPEQILNRMAELLEGGEDKLLEIATNLARWVREEDATRWVTCGSVHPSVGLASGYADIVDVVGFNYRAVEYEGAHQMYPDKKIYGSENWVTRAEWNAVEDKDYVGGIFVWTGFAYKGEAGPWPRKGLNISLFDYTGILTPRGHMFETLWKADPKSYMTTIALADSEHSYDENDGWKWQRRAYEPEAMAWLRLWEWDRYEEHWNYEDQQPVLVQVYTNSDKAELLLNGESLGVQNATDFDDSCLKWIVPFKKGKLEVVGLDENGEVESNYVIQTTGEAVGVTLSASRNRLNQGGSEVIEIFVDLVDARGSPIRHEEQVVAFEATDNLQLRAIDNGSEYYVGSHQVDQIETFKGRAYAVFECADDAEAGRASITVSVEGGNSSTISLEIK